MTVRAVEWKQPYTWGKAIEIDENKVISLRLRDENNLIIWDEWDNEIYVDLQLPDELQPTDAFPVWITTGRVIVDNWWDEAWTIICAKTTSGDNIKLLYADSGNLYIDNGTWTFKQIYLKADVDTLLLALRSYIDDELAKKQNWVASSTAPESPTEWDLWYDTINDELKVYDWTNWNSIWSGWAWWTAKIFELATNQDLTTAQEAYEWYLAWKYPIIKVSPAQVLCPVQEELPWELYFIWAWYWYSTSLSGGDSDYYAQWYKFTITNGTVTAVSDYRYHPWISFLATNVNYSPTYTPQYNGSPATKKYVDDSLLSTQSNNILQSWMKIWAWLESDYQNLGSYDQNTIYLTI